METATTWLRGVLAVAMFLGAGLLFATPAAAGSSKVEICHLPPSNPTNAHTIRVSETAIQAHLKHGDFLGPCDQPCEQRCDDGNACTVDSCDANYVCQNDEVVDCDDTNECTTDSCDRLLGECVYQNVGAGESCTWSDELYCTLAQGECNASGECTPVYRASCCDAAADCVDTDLCTSEGCDLVTHTCEETAETTCDTNKCWVGVCIRATGDCEFTPTFCRDPEVCETFLGCDDDLGCEYETDLDCCDPDNPLACDDGNNCTWDVCDPATNTCSNPNCAPDLGKCFQILTCDAADCTPVNVVEDFCDDSNPCTDDSCDFYDGCANVFNCDDGNFCTDDSCDSIAGECMSVPTTNPPELVETLCADGLDNDCDGATDTDDLADCPVSPCSFNNGGCGDERVFLCADDEAGEIGCSVRDEIYQPSWNLEPYLVDLSGVDLSGADLSSYLAPDGSTMVACFLYTNLSGATCIDTDLSDAMLAWADLTNANLTGTNFTNASLDRANLTNANLAGANLRSSCIGGSWCQPYEQTSLTRANLSGANLASADLSGAVANDVDLTNADLTGANLSHTELRQADLTNANLLDTDLTGSNLLGADLSGTELRLATLSGANLSYTDIPNVDLSGMDLSFVVFGNADLSGANLGGATLSYATFEYTNLVGTDLSETDLALATFSNTLLAGANLTNADLSGVDLSQHNSLRGTNFTNANLTGADLRSAALENANLGGANLTDAILADANLTNVNFRGANLYNAIFIRADVTYADFSMADLRSVNVLNNISYAQNIRDAVFLGTQLQGVYFHWADLSGADLTGANLNDARLDSADLTGANLHLANLNGTFLRSANLHDADVSDADMTQAYVQGAIFTPANLSNVVLTGAYYDDETVFPAGFVPSDYAMVDTTGW